MSENFTLANDDTRKLFRRPSRAMRCRQLVYSRSKAALSIPLAIADLVRDNPEFRSA